MRLTRKAVALLKQGRATAREGERGILLCGIHDAQALDELERAGLIEKGPVRGCWYVRDSEGKR